MLALTSLMILLPILAGLILWDQLPDQLPRHWNAAGEIDGWSSKSFAIIGLPLLLLVLHWLCVIGTYADPKKNNHPDKILHLIFWIVPVISVLMNTLVYAVALGKSIQINLIMPIFVGLVFVIIGNYLPKCQQNYTIGIKIPWTLHSEENWNHTHRFAGKLWVVCGFIILLTGFFDVVWLFLPVVLLMVGAPLVYSYRFYRKENTRNSLDES